jgi:hypothetical protein
MAVVLVPTCDAHAQGAARQGRMSQRLQTLDTTRTKRSIEGRYPGAGTAMKCLACGASMSLMQVEPRGDPTSEVAFERQTFKCSACSQISQRLAFSRPRSPISDLEIAPPSRYSPSANMQIRRLAGANALAKVAENLRLGRRRIGTEARAAAPIASTWSEGFEERQTQNTPVQERKERALEARRTSTWAEVVEKVRTRQIGLQDRAGSIIAPRTSRSATGWANGRGRAGAMAR